MDNSSGAVKLPNADYDSRDGVLPRNPLAELLAFGVVERAGEPALCNYCAVVSPDMSYWVSWRCECPEMGS